MMNSYIISDSACLIALDRIGKLSILKSLYQQILIPEAVYKEFGKSIDWINIQRVNTPNLVRTLQTQLDFGESEAIALALEKDNTTLILDDKKARRIAEELGMKIIGTIGILLKAKKASHIKQVKPLLDQLNDVDFRISDSLYRKALELAGEL